MREAIGGAWLLGIAVVIISVFTSYLAFSVNYAKAFKVKDGIVERIEKWEGYDKDKAGKEINDYLNKIGYNIKGNCSKVVKSTDTSKCKGAKGTTVGNCTSTGLYNYCVERVYIKGNSGRYDEASYKVTVFYGLTVGMIDLNSHFFLTGETKNIYYPTDNGKW